MTSLSLFIFMRWRRKWQPTPVFLPGKSQGRGSLVGCCLWSRTESDMTDTTWQQQQVSSVQFSCSVASNSLQPHGLKHARLPFPSSTHVYRVSDAFYLSHPLSSPSPPDFNLSQHQIFSIESVLHIRWPKYWSFSFNISPSNEHSGLISFRMDWFELLQSTGLSESS